MKPAVPGWYADPRGESRYRYWNGSAWTELIAASLWEVQRINEAQAVAPSPEWAWSSPRRKQGDWFDQLLPWLVEDEETGKTPLGQLLFFVSWIALTIFLLSGGCWWGPAARAKAHLCRVLNSLSLLCATDSLASAASNGDGASPSVPVLAGAWVAIAPTQSRPARLVVAHRNTV